MSIRLVVQARSDLIPGIAVLLQKQWRGYLCRQKYKRMKATVTIMLYYRRYKMRSYIAALQRTFRDAKSMKDYGKRLQWPAENFAVRSVVPALKAINARWHAWMGLKGIPREEWPQLRIKMTACAALRSKRPQWGQNRRWDGNYLSQQSENHHTDLYNAAINNLRNTDHFKSVLFSAFIKKTNKFNKVADRVLVVSEQAIYKLDSTKFKFMKRKTPIAEITGLSVSPGKDQLITIHSNCGNDIVISIISKEDKVGEIVGVLSNAYYLIRGMDLQVTVDTRFKCMLGNKSKLLRVEVMPEVTEPTFKKDGECIIYALPPSLNIIDVDANNGRMKAI